MIHVLPAAAVLLLCRSPVAASPPGEPPLSGPRVVDAPKLTTIVERDFNDRVKRPDPSPEEAAYAMTHVPEAEAAAVGEKVDAILRARMVIFDDFVAGNLDLLNKLGTAGATDNKLEQFALLSEAYRKLKPLRDRGTLASEIEKALPESSREEFSRMMKEYQDAVVQEFRADERRAAATGGEGEMAAANADSKGATAEKKPDVKPRFGILAEENLKQFGRDIERSLYRQLKNGEILYRYMTVGLKLTPEQQKSIHAKCLDFADRTKGEEIKAEQMKLFLSIWRDLDPEQRKEFGKRVNGKK